MKKRNNYFACILLVCTVFVSSFFIEFQSDAANIYYSQFEEPTVNEYCGYINLEIDLANGGPSCVTLAWSIIPTEIKNDATLLPTTMMNITVNQSNVVLNTVGNGQADCHVLVWELNASDQYLILKNSYPSSGSVSVTDAWNGTITGFSVYGNYGSISSYMGTYNPSCTVIWADEELMLNRLTQIYQAIVNTNNNLGGKLDSLVSKVGTLISEVDNVEETLASIKNLVNEYYPKFETELQNIVDRLDTLIEQSASDKNATDKFEEDSSSQTDKLNDLNEQNKVDKTDVDSASGTVDEYIDGESIESYGSLLSVFTSNQYILRMILIVLAIGLISYVLFGKR